MAHLVFQTAYPGDLFLAIPLLKRIKEWEPEARLVLACRYLLDLGEEETAEVLGVRRGTVKSRTSRALDRLRAQLEGRDV